MSVEWPDIAEIQASDEHSAALEHLAAGKAKLLELGIDKDED